MVFIATLILNDVPFRMALCGLQRDVPRLLIACWKASIELAFGYYTLEIWLNMN